MTGNNRDEVKGAGVNRTALEKRCSNTSPTGGGMKLKDLVEYQDRTVASRMIVNKPAGSVTLFSFDEGEGLSEHTAPYDAMVTILDGECEVWLAGETHLLKEGDTIIFPANAPHALSAVARFKMMLVMIRE